jgi:two-component system, cell cycle response regulator
MIVMIVDDTRPNVLVLQQALTNTGYNISVAFDGEKALDLIPKLKPDLILLDVMMPGLNGFEVCTLLKENPEVSDIPIIFITAMGMPKDLLAGFEAGEVDYITKPFNLQEVCVRVKTHLTLSAAIKKLIQDSETDSLTDLFNRQTLLKNIENEAMHFKRSKKPFSFLFADIDFFKKINDTYGHAAGDDILINISNILNTEKREVELVGRWGEFFAFAS